MRERKGARGSVSDRARHGHSTSVKNRREGCPCRPLVLLRYTRGGDQSEEGQEDIPGPGTNRRRDKRIYPGQGPIGGGTRGYTRGRDQSEEGQALSRWGWCSGRCWSVLYQTELKLESGT
eukprot:1177076-Prorocentrum_minimum.AAC.1